MLGCSNVKVSIVRDQCVGDQHIDFLQYSPLHNMLRVFAYLPYAIATAV